MASIEEDEDLIALRSAVLASMKVKPNEKDVIEEDAELLALRQAALQSKKQQHIEEQDGPKHTEQLAIGRPPRLAAPPKQFHSAPQGWGNLIVIPLQEERGPPQGQKPPQTSTHKPILLLPQDKWARGGASGATGTENAVASTKEKKALSKFSRFESRDSDSEEEDEDSDKSEEVDLLEKQIEQFLQGDQDDSASENGHSPAGRPDNDHSECKSPAAQSENDHSVGDSSLTRSDGQCEEDGLEADESNEQNLNVDSINCCDKNNDEDLVKNSTETDKGVGSRSSSHTRSLSSSSSGSSSSSHSSSSWSSSWSSGSQRSRPQSASPCRHKHAISASKQKDSHLCDAKTMVKPTARGQPRAPGEQRSHKLNWERSLDSRSVSLKVSGGRSSSYSDERRLGKRTSPPDLRQPVWKQPPREMPSRQHPRDRLGHRATPTSDVAKDAREKLEDRKRKFASNKTIQPDKRGTTVVPKSVLPSGEVTTDKENRQSNVKLRLGTDKYRPHSRKDSRMHTDGANPGNAHTKPEPLLTKARERLDSFKSDDLSDSSDLFSFSDSESDDASSAPWRQKNMIERDETQLNQERYIRRRNNRCVNAMLVVPRDGTRVPAQDLRHRSRRGVHLTPPRAKHLKPRDGSWAARREDSGSDGDTCEKDNRSLRSVMSVVRKNTDSADSQGDRGRSSSRNREHKRRKRKDSPVVVDVRVEPSKRMVVKEGGTTKGKGKASREEDARSIIQRLKRKGGEVEVEFEEQKVKKPRKTPLVVARVSPTINITFNKDAELPKPDARMSVHERLGMPRKRRHGRESPPPPAVPPKMVSGQLESQVHVARKVVRYNDHSEDDSSSHKRTNGSCPTEGKAVVTRKHQVLPPVDKEMYSKKKTLLVLKTAGRRERHKLETRQSIKLDHGSHDHVADEKATASTGHHYESELDAKIRKIKEKNDQIMRRKQQIEEDKKKYG